MEKIHDYDYEYKSLLKTHALYSFITAITAIIVPLWLVHKKITVGEIGLIFAASPFIFLILRLIFAALADNTGPKRIGIIYSISGLTSIILYLFSPSAMIYGFAKIAEGIRSSAFWAISRSEIIHDEQTKEEQGSILARFSSVREIASASGNVMAGVFILALAFEHIFYALIIFSALLILFTLDMSNNIRKQNREQLHEKNPGIRSIANKIFAPQSKNFWKNSTWLSIISLGPTSSVYLLALYFGSALNIETGTTAIILTVLAIITALSSWLSTQLNFGIRELLFLNIAGIIGFISAYFAGNHPVILWGSVILLGIGNSAATLIWEFLVVGHVRSGNANLATKLGLTNVPLRILEIIFFASSGFIISSFGYLPLFIFCSGLIAIFMYVVLIKRNGDFHVV